MSYLNHLTFLLLLCIGLFACKSSSTTEEIAIDFGYDYFPLAVGKYQDYQVDSILYDTTGMGVIQRNSRTYVREQIVDTLTDNLGRTQYRIERFEKKNLSDPWEIKDVWTAVITDTQAERVEENLRFIKMVFPLEEGILFNGNAFIDEYTVISIEGEPLEIFKGWEYEIEEVDVSAAIGNEFYENITTIFQSNSENAIELRTSFEQYAKGIGLVYKEQRILDTQNVSSQPWEQKAQKGFIMTQLLIGHN